MKRVLPIALSILLIVLVSPSILALNMDVTKTSENEIMILGLNEPAIFDLVLKNYGPEDNLIFYTYFTPSLFPKGTVPIGEATVKEVQVEVYPPQTIKEGYSQFELVIRGQDGSEVKKQLVVNVVSFDNIFEIGSASIDAESQTIEVYIQNKVNFNFQDLDVEFKSAFFDANEKMSLGPYEKKNITISLNKEDFKELMAGYYTMTAKVKAKGLTTEVDGRIDFAENRN